MELSKQVDAAKTPVSDPQDLFLRHHRVIEQVIRVVCRRHWLSPEDTEDFAGIVCIHLLENDCAVLRRFSGRSSMATYLTAVITHLGQDWRNARWGKWRPSAAAKRGGPLALHLERLLCRDSLTLDEALETLRTNHRVVATRVELERLASTFPIRLRRQMIAAHPTAATSVTLNADPLVARAARRRAAAAAVVLGRAFGRLSPEARHLLTLRFRDGMRIADIARKLQQPEKPLYRQIERLLEDLRRELVSHGFTRPALRDAFDQMDVPESGAGNDPDRSHGDTRFPSPGACGYPWERAEQRPNVCPDVPDLQGL